MNDSLKRDEFGSQAPFKVEFLLIQYSFDFSNRRISKEGRTYLEVGRNDVGISLAVPTEGAGLYLMDRNPVFVNTSLSAFIKCMEALKGEPLFSDEDAPNSLRVSRFREILLSIDPSCFRDQNAFWSTVQQEMEADLI